MMKINKKMCNQCLFSPNKIVGESRKQEIISNCKKKQTHFLCHKAEDVVCGGFNKVMGEYSQMIRISQRLNMIELVDVEQL